MIDLDAPDADDRPDQWNEGPWRRYRGAWRGLSRTERRRWGACFVAVVTLMSLGGAAVPGQPPAPRLVGALRSGDVRVLASSGDLLRVQRAGSGSGEIYRVDDRITRVVAGAYVDIYTTWRDTVLVAYPCPNGDGLAAAGIDGRTGAWRWRRDGNPVVAGFGYLAQRRATAAPCGLPAGGWSTPGVPAPPAAPVFPLPSATRSGVVSRIPSGTVVTAVPSGTVAAAVPSGAAGGPVGLPVSAAGPGGRQAQPVDIVDVVTGRTLWSLAGDLKVDPVITRDTAGRPVLVAIDASGRWVLRDLRTGAVRGPTGVTAPPGEPQQVGILDPATGKVVEQWRVGGGSLVAFADAMVISTFGSSGGALQVVDPETFAPLWTSPGLSIGSYATGCGALLCVTGMDGTVVIAPHTGAVLWQAPKVIGALAGSHWAVTAPAAMSTADLELVDLRTGRVSADLHGWALDRINPSFDPRIQRSAVVMVYRYAHGRTWFGVIDPDHGTMAPRVIGSVSGTYLRCTTGSTLIACDRAGVLSIWRVPPA